MVLVLTPSLFFDDVHDWKPVHIRVDGDIVSGFMVCMICAESRIIHKDLREAKA